MKWLPSVHQTNMAVCLAEHFCRFTLSDNKKTADKDPNAAFDWFVPVIPEDFTICGVPYTNYTRKCIGFSVAAGDQLWHRYIAVQHLPPTPAPLTDKEKAKPFTVYVGVDNGHVGLDLGDILYYSSAGPPFQLGREHINGSSGCTSRSSAFLEGKEEKPKEESERDVQVEVDIPRGDQ